MTSLSSRPSRSSAEAPPGGLVRLACGLQHYSWGERSRPGHQPFLADLCGLVAPKDVPFAELWIGAHPDLPSRVLTDAGPVPLGDWLAAAPAARLGRAVTARTGGRLPFLLKVLSCERALSIQAHPDARLARQLHRRDPQHYPDPFAKPEIAIALTSFTALAGFRYAREIRADVRRLPALQTLLAPVTGLRPWLQHAYARLFRAPPDVLGHALAQLATEVRGTLQRTPRDGWFLELLDQFPNDRGALSVYFLNLVDLQPGHALFLRPGLPHAYLRGAIVECMGNSNNVVRAGLTPKFVDVDVLLRMLPARAAGVPRLSARPTPVGGRVYVPPQADFRVEQWRIEPGGPVRTESGGVGSVLLVLAGTLTVRTPAGVVQAARGSAWFWPAAETVLEWQATADPVEVVRASPRLSRG